LFISSQSKIEQEVLEVTKSMQSLSNEMKRNHQCAIDSQYINSFNELLEVREVHMFIGRHAL